jgi:hypothetical protein
MNENKEKNGIYGAYVFYGPSSVLIIAIILTLTTRQSEVVFLFLITVVPVFVFYGIGFFPAMLTAFLTEQKIKKSGYCLWYQSAGYGAFSSALIIGAPAVISGTGKFIQSGNIFVLGDPLAICGIMLLFGFFGTIPAWYFTRTRQTKLAAAFLERQIAQ